MPDLQLTGVLFRVFDSFDTLFRSFVFDLFYLFDLFFIVLYFSPFLLVRFSWQWVVVVVCLSIIG